MPVDAAENRGLDLLHAALSVIGTPPSSWLTAPVLHPEPPTVDALPSAESAPHLFAVYVRTEPQRESDASARRHGWRLWYAVLAVGKDLRTAVALVDDARRAIYAAEGAITTALEQPAFPQSATARDDLYKSGCYVVQLDVFIDTSTQHA